MPRRVTALAAGIEVRLTAVNSLTMFAGWSRTDRKKVYWAQGKAKWAIHETRSRTKNETQKCPKSAQVGVGVREGGEEERGRREERGREGGGREGVVWWWWWKQKAVQWQVQVQAWVLVAGVLQDPDPEQAGGNLGHLLS